MPRAKVIVAARCASPLRARVAACSLPRGSVHSAERPLEQPGRTDPGKPGSLSAALCIQSSWIVAAVFVAARAQSARLLLSLLLLTTPLEACRRLVRGS